MLCDALAALARLLLLRLWLGRRRLLFASWGVVAAEVRATGGAAAGVDGAASDGRRRCGPDWRQGQFTVYAPALHLRSHDGAWPGGMAGRHGRAVGVVSGYIMCQK